MKKTKIIILSSLVFSTITPALAISCGINTNKNKKSKLRNKNKKCKWWKFSLKKIW
nr:hypothetical protein [Mycoplasmopsis synoviae]